MQAQQSQSWWARNWKWVVPTGCLGMIVLFVAVGVSIFVLITGSMRSSWAYSNAVELARSNPEVLAALGEPLETGWLFSGTINVTVPSGQADLAIPLKGPRGSGTMFVIAEKRAGRWEFELVEVEVEGPRERIDLLEPQDE